MKTITLFLLLILLCQTVGRPNLGGYFADRGEYPKAEAEFRAALALDDQFVPAWVNLADLMRLQGREADAQKALRDGLAISPNDATLHHALGLAASRKVRLDPSAGCSSHSRSSPNSSTSSIPIPTSSATPSAMFASPVALSEG